MAEFADFSLDLNLEDVNAWNGEYSMIAEGSYVFEISNVEQKPTSSGHPGLKFTFTVVDDSSEKDKTLTKTYSLKNDPKVLGRFKAMLVAAGYTASSIVGSELLSRRFVADVKHGMMPDRTLPDGTVQPGKPSMDIRNERALDVAQEQEPEPAPAVVAAKKTATAAAKNGTATARR